MLLSYIYMLWSYYLVQVWLFEGLLSGPSLCFKTLSVRNTIKIGVSAQSFSRKVARGLLSGPSLRF